MIIAIMVPEAWRSQNFKKFYLKIDEMDQMFDTTVLAPYGR